MSITPIPLLLAVAPSNAALLAFLGYTLVVFGLAIASNRLLQRKSFLSEYFLGSRGLGVWAFALTFAATSASGGTFTGFPAKIYSHGWILGLWIASYMVVPICTMGLLGKRLNQVARRSGAITVPDVLRDRFHSRAFGLVAVMLIVFFMSFSLVAQFKAGSLILKTLLDEVPLFQQSALVLAGGITGPGTWLPAVDPEYLLCLLGFGIAVVLYTTYGGFRAVVWTDVMQGFVMVGGVLIMLPLTLMMVGRLAPPDTGGLEFATREMAKMTPPRPGTAQLVLAAPSDQDRLLRAGEWVTMSTEGPRPRLFRVAVPALIPAGARTVDNVVVWETTTPEEIDRQLEKRSTASPPGESALAADMQVAQAATEPYAYGDAADQRGAYVYGPGPSRTEMSGFLPLSLAISFFFMWAISGAGQPSNMVRLMAFRDSRTLRLSMITVAGYFTAIYLPLLVIFCCARVLLPGMDAEPDRIMPEMAIFLSREAGVAWLAGLLVAAPFAAVMSTVDSFLLMISSALVRDIYQRNLNPQARERTVKRLSYAVTMVVGTAAMIGAINPPMFLQDIIVYVGSGLAACFLAPMVYALYWPRANAPGCIAAMLGGFIAHLSLYVAGIFVSGSFFTPVQLANLDPILLGLGVSFLSGYLVTKMTAPPAAELVHRYFHRQKPATES